jgi:hypothetical protein
MQIIGTSNTLNIKIKYSSWNRGQELFQVTLPFPWVHFLNLLNGPSPGASFFFFLSTSVYWSVQSWIGLLSITVQACDQGECCLALAGIYLSASSCVLVVDHGARGKRTGDSRRTVFFWIRQLQIQDRMWTCSQCTVDTGGTWSLCSYQRQIRVKRYTSFSPACC